MRKTFTKISSIFIIAFLLFSIILKAQNFNCNDNLTDTRDGKVYKTIKIGTQCWMAENLNIGNGINGTSEQTNNGIIEKYCYDNDENNCNIYGGLYQWDEMMKYVTTEETQGICPQDWHIPSNNDWTILMIFLGDSSTVGGILKSNSNLWNSPNIGATNISGFSALPAGHRNIVDGSFVYIGYITYFWSSSEYDSTLARFYYLVYNFSDFFKVDNYKKNGISTRCVMNDNIVNNYMIDGYITYENIQETPISDAWIYLIKEGAKIDSIMPSRDGYYTFSNLVSGEYTLKVKPTLTWGGAFSVDALIINKYFVGLLDIKLPLQKLAADVSNDNIMNPADGLFILKRYVSLISKFNIPDWIYIEPPFILNSNLRHNIKVICAGDVNSSYPK